MTAAELLTFLGTSEAPDAGVADWIAGRLGRPGLTPAWSGAEQMSPEEIQRATPAAVLIPLVNRPGGLTILLTQRTAELRDHAGQISFPGGRMATGETDPIHTALRETREEIGLSPDQIRILGVMPDYLIPTGFRVKPVVGWLQPPLHITPDPAEVAEVFELPVAVAFDPSRHQLASAWRHGRSRQFYAMPWEGRDIWGATAGMMVNLYHALTQGA